MKKPEIAFELYTRKPTADWTVGRRLLTFLTEFDDRLVPQTLDNWGVKREFISVEETEPYWAIKSIQRGTKDHYYYNEMHLSVGLKRKRVVNYHTELRHMSVNRKGRVVPARMHFTATYHKAIDWEELFLGVCDILESNTAFMHYFGDSEKRWSLVRGKYYKDMSHHFLVPAKYVQEQTKDFAHYIEDELVQKIKGEGFLVKKVNDGHLIKVTDNLQDVIDDFDVFAARRDQLKAMFPEGLFKS